MTNTKEFTISQDFLDGTERDDVTTIPRQPNTTRVAKKNLRLVQTELGTIIAFEKHLRFRDNQDTPTIYTVVPGFYSRELPSTPDGLRKIAVELIPPDQREKVSTILRQQGHKGPFDYWFNYSGISYSGL